MVQVVRADAALFERTVRDHERVLESAPGAVLSWAALHLLAEHGWRWRPTPALPAPALSTPASAATAPSGLPSVGDLLHVDLTIEHPPSARLVLGQASARFLAALGRTPSYARHEGDEPVTPSALTRLAERRAPASSTFVVGADGVGGLLVVERGRRSVFETLRVVVAVWDRSALRDGLEAALQSVSHGRHPQAGVFSTSRGRQDGVTDPVLRGPVTPLAVFAGARALRARGLVARAEQLGGAGVGSVRAPGAVFWFDGTEPERWRAAAELARGALAGELQRAPWSGDDGRRTGEVR